MFFVINKTKRKLKRLEKQRESLLIAIDTIRVSQIPQAELHNARLSSIVKAIDRRLAEERL
jgi:hypothetical protein